MTKKHFRAFASALHSLRPPATLYIPEDDPAKAFWWETCRSIAKVCRQFNPDFDTDRFYRWCLEGDDL